MDYPKYCVGQPVAFLRDDKMISFGVVTAIAIIFDNFEYEIAELPDEEGNEDFYIVKENDIMDPPEEPQILRCSDWVEEHLEEINKAFGRDIRDFALVIDYDSIEEFVKDWGEERFVDPEWKNYIRIVKNKIVVIAC